MHLRIAIVDGGFSGTGRATCLKQHIVVVCLPSLRESQDLTRLRTSVRGQLDG